MQDLAVVELHIPSRPGISTPAEVLAAFLARRSERTRRAYGADLRAFACHLGQVDPAETLRYLAGLQGCAANAAVLAWRQAMVEAHLAPATINRRLSTIRSLTRMLRTVGLVSWTLEVEGERGGLIRDTRGPEVRAVEALIKVAKGQKNRDKAKRDVALIRLLFDLALRRQEVVSLDLEHADLAGGTISVLGKGQAGRSGFTLPPETREALATWIETRGSQPGPMFTSLDRARGSRTGDVRLTGEGLRVLLRSLARRAGLGDIRPHGLRHAAITAALDATGGDVRAVQRFSRHVDVRTLQRYDDNRQDLGGKVARKVAALVA